MNEIKRYLAYDLSNEIILACCDYNLNYWQLCLELGISINNARSIKNASYHNNARKFIKSNSIIYHDTKKLCEYLDIRMNMYESDEGEEW